MGAEKTTQAQTNRHRTAPQRPQIECTHRQNAGTMAPDTRSLMQLDMKDLEQQITMRAGFLKGYLKDLELLAYWPEYRSEYFNESAINDNIQHQTSCLEQLWQEVERRRIP